MNKKTILIFGLVILTIVIGIVYFEHHKKEIYEDLFVEFPSYYNQFLTFKYDGSVLAIKPLEAQASQIKKESDSKIVYLDAYPEVDVVQEKEKIRLKEQLILKKPGHPQEFKFLVKADGLLAEKQDNGDLIFYKILERLFVLPAPFMVDADGRKSDTKDVEMNFDSENSLLIIKPSKEWLDQAKYPVILDPTVEISILNPYSRPRTGEEWEVEFTTKGEVDLTIIPEDKATINDLDFVSLKCGEEERIPQILDNDVIFYAKWSCDNIGRITHLVNIAGSHTLRFQFGNQIAYAYNHPDWANVAWGYRKKITINSTVVSESDSGETDFPMMINIASDSDLANDAQPDGDDIMFTDSTGLTKLDHEVEKYDNEGDLIAWVEVPSLSSTSDTYLYMYYGNGDVDDQSNADGTWRSEYKGVWHMDAASGDESDSSGNNNTLTEVGTASSTTGKIYNARDFNDNTDGFTKTDAASIQITGDISASSWVQRNAIGANHGLMGKADMDSRREWHLSIRSTNKLEFAYYSSDGSTATVITENSASFISAGVWYHVAVAVDVSAQSATFWVNGSISPNSSTGSESSIPDTTAKFVVSDRYSSLASRRLFGQMDEVRLYSGLLTDYWVSNEYNNMASASAFYNVGSEENAPPVSRIKGSLRIKGGVRFR